MSNNSAPVDEPYPWELALGARPVDDGRTEFRVWAPRAETVQLRQSAGAANCLG